VGEWFDDAEQVQLCAETFSQGNGMGQRLFCHFGTIEGQQDALIHVADLLSEEPSWLVE
jgi:hypothetical protein